MFVKEVLLDDPLANTQAVNDAWSAAGMEGTISATLVNRIRSQMKLTGNLRSGRRKKSRAGDAAKAGSIYTGKRRGRPPKQIASLADGTTQVKTRGRKSALGELEVDLDRLLFKVMGIGNLTRFEDALRRARRLLYEEVSVEH
jgi:hypothetical protein